MGEQSRRMQSSTWVMLEMKREKQTGAETAVGRPQVGSVRVGIAAAGETVGEAMALLRLESGRGRFAVQRQPSASHPPERKVV